MRASRCSYRPKSAACIAWWIRRSTEWRTPNGRLATAIPLLGLAAGGEVQGMIGSHDPLAAIADAINLRGFDEVIVSMLQPRLSHWLHLDVARKVAAMGVPVTTVVAANSPRPLAA